ncbi:MAG TPA: twin-arginine translocation signal domain-containing protein, partial [Ktedonobacteraceae bacterium]
MSSQERELFDPLFSPHNRREFMKRAGAIGLSGAALSAFLEACGSTGGGGGTTPTTTVNMAGPIDMPTLMSHAKTEGQLQ